MNSEGFDLARLRIERAEETLQDAKRLLADGSLRSAVNRFYYKESERFVGITKEYLKQYIKIGGTKDE